MFIPLVRGHCGNPRLREKKEDSLACQRYVEVVEDGNGMVERRGVVWARPRSEEGASSLGVSAFLPTSVLL